VACPLSIEICGIRITDKNSISDLKIIKEMQCNNISDLSPHQLSSKSAPASAAELEGYLLLAFRDCLLGIIFLAVALHPLSEDALCHDKRPTYRWRNIFMTPIKKLFSYMHEES
jgi:hypothetical protein